MTDPDHDPGPSLDELIDRLVDGPVSPAELRHAFRRLDAAPDGWRRCALAFLEAQSWGEALRFGGEAVPSRPAPHEDEVDRVLPLAAAPRPRPPFRGRRALAAAAILAAFALGWFGRGWRAVDPVRPEPLLADRVADPGPAAPDPPAPAPRPEPVASAPPRPVPPVREVARVRLGDGETPTAEVPILAGSGIDERWLQNQPPAVSEYQRAVWERHGYRLEERRRLVSVPLDDGRRAAIPVDQVKVRYVGRDPL